MSIAVAAVIRTPVCLRLLQAALGLCAVLAAWPLSGAWRVAAVSGQLVGGYALGWSAALLSAAGGVFLLALLRRRRKPQALDISPVGQVRLAVYLERGEVPGAIADGGAEPAGPGLAGVQGLRLLPGSTLWPSLLVLCLADAAGRRTDVLVQRGGSCAAFRPLAVACRAIAARNREE
ncbi:hypothetical protein [Janthinobacterium lividum]|uniref:hypothetical protein n=1 Tax=Janthinobacterium lividum TaxID=29581 RepID=UPI000893AAB3|nr:hypothetical protein [Janthinobacterium lividum]MCC7696498.1 hypothetical protein [Janthinobacterium sp. EB271-G4-7A]OEZ58253.1 hypothetical protein JANLI_19940 [Janthinobacterium lividum]STQ98270.1 Uncharacterised protein [Janthinobacterium lividum]